MVMSWRLMASLAKSMAKLMEKPSSGVSAADFPVSPTVIGFSTLIARRGASCSTIPAHSIRKTNGRGAAVHHRHFRAVELDHGIVDLEPGQRRHQMLDGGDRQPFTVIEPGAERLLDGVAPAGLDLGAGAVAAAEDDAGIGRGRMQRHADPPSGMQRHTPAMNCSLQGFLLRDPHFVHRLPPTCSNSF